MVGPAGLALAALTGTWLGHALEYARVWHGAAGFVAVHTYMGPVGAVLAAAAIAGMRATRRLAVTLQRRLDAAHRRPMGHPGPEPWSLSVPAVTLVLWVWQCALYVLQENLEQAVTHHSLIGLGAVSGAHAWAPAVHLAVAAGVACVLWLVRRRVTRLVAEVHAAERRLWAEPADDAAWTPARTWTPSERWGRQRWSRPPPATA